MFIILLWTDFPPNHLCVGVHSYLPLFM